MENLIEKLREESLYRDKCTLEIMDLCMEAAEELERLQTENVNLIAANKAVALDNRYLRDELEQVKTERDAAIKDMCHIAEEGVLKMNNDIRAALLGDHEREKL